MRKDDAFAEGAGTVASRCTNSRGSVGNKRLLQFPMTTNLFDVHTVRILYDNMRYDELGSHSREYPGSLSIAMDLGHILLQVIH